MTTERSNESPSFDNAIDRELRQALLDQKVSPASGDIVPQVLGRVHRRRLIMRLAPLACVTVLLSAGWIVVQSVRHRSGELIGQTPGSASEHDGAAQHGPSGDDLFAARFPLPPPVVELHVVDSRPQALLDYLESIDPAQENR